MSGTCDGCRWWIDVIDIDGERWGECNLLSEHDDFSGETSDRAYIGDPNVEERSTFKSRSDFGCVEWATT